MYDDVIYFLSPLITLIKFNRYLYIYNFFYGNSGSNKSCKTFCRGLKIQEKTKNSFNTDSMVNKFILDVLKLRVN